ncbi:hypothetical protein FRC05_005061, partial [Tulasnella sp. 425]
MAHQQRPAFRDSHRQVWGVRRRNRSGGRMTGARRAVMAGAYMGRDPRHELPFHVKSVIRARITTRGPAESAEHVGGRSGIFARPILCTR